jgi:cytoskeletal protein CcmA (bactofilin family)
MFTKKPDRDAFAADTGSAMATAARPSGTPPAVTSARPASSARAAGAASVIGADLTITGNLESKGEIQIEGEIQGDVHAARIVIGERARITGSLLAKDIVVRGNVAGSIRGINITLQAASRVEGDVFHKSLAIEEGAFFEGKSRRTEDPMSVQRTANGMPPPG